MNTVIECPAVSPNDPYLIGKIKGHRTHDGSIEHQCEILTPDNNIFRWYELLPTWNPEGVVNIITDRLRRLGVRRPIERA